VPPRATAEVILVPDERHERAAPFREQFRPGCDIGDVISKRDVRDDDEIEAVDATRGGKYVVRPVDVAIHDIEGWRRQECIPPVDAV
jgi:hypothetical protein